MMRLLAFFVLLAFAEPVFADWKGPEQATYIHRSIKKVTDVIVYDIYSPPVASRTYAYISLAAYEAVIPANHTYKTFAGQLQSLGAVPQPLPGKQYSPTLAAVQAVLTVGKALVISEEKIDAFKSEILQEFKDNGMPADVFENSVSYGQQVARHILAWADKDNYRESRSLAKYAVSDAPATWKPTPPAYIKAIEPHWNKMRTFIINSAQQFKPAPATPFSASKSSTFYKLALEVKNAGNNLSPEQSQVANFWDCNPFKMNVKGHVMFATKKISPGGHWINITHLACEKTNADIFRTAEAYACVSITLADCFISCWDEKYRSNVIRPETYINQYIDADWVPLLQTPPFPEYTSGHSVVSSAAAVVLTKMFGDNFSFVNSTENEFGLLPRRFSSFKLAAEEAAISRFYGGIHYMPAIKNGFDEGRRLGEFITGRLQTRRQGVFEK